MNFNRGPSDFQCVLASLRTRPCTYRPGEPHRDARIAEARTPPGKNTRPPALFRKVHTPGRCAPSRPPETVAWGSAGSGLLIGAPPTRSGNDRYGPRRKLGAGGLWSHGESPVPGIQMSEVRPPARREHRTVREGSTQPVASCSCARPRWCAQAHRGRVAAIASPFFGSCPVTESAGGKEGVRKESGPAAEVAHSGRGTWRTGARKYNLPNALPRRVARGSDVKGLGHYHFSVGVGDAVAKADDVVFFAAGGLPEISTRSAGPDFQSAFTNSRICYLTNVNCPVGLSLLCTHAFQPWAGH